MSRYLARRCPITARKNRVRFRSYLPKTTVPHIEVNMHLSLITVLALCGCSALAAPAPAAVPNASLQKDIQTLEITILNVINDIVQNNKAGLKKDFATGQNEFGSLIASVAGPLPCSPFVPGNPSTASGAISYLRNSQSNLQELSLDLMNPALSVQKSDFHADVCSAWGWFWGVNTFASK